MNDEHPLQVARCTKIIKLDEAAAEAARAVNSMGALQGQKGADEQDKYLINIKQIAKFVVSLGDRVAPTDIEEGMRVGYVVRSYRAEPFQARPSFMQRRSQQVPNPDSPSSKDRRLSNYDASRGEARRNILRRRRVQRSD